MRLSAVDIRDLRVLTRVGFEPGPRNVIHGPNASGKTSLLEAIHLLGFGRSFLGGRGDALIRSGAGPLRVVGRIVGPTGVVHRAGVERAGAGERLRVRIDGQEADTLADLARLFPVIAVHPGSHELLAGGPAERRRMLDWGLFHVEQGYLWYWQRFRRALGQRNAALRGGQDRRRVTAWDGELVAAAEMLDAQRASYVECLAASIGEMQGRLLRDGPIVEVRYRRGWPADRSLADVLVERIELDFSRATTTAGPHRGEVVVRWNGQDARNRVSRGQQKLLVFLLRLAQARHLQARAGVSPVLLFDDLAAELDRDHVERVLAEATALDLQMFVTALEPGVLPLDFTRTSNLFHVEQGELQEVVQ